MASTNNGSELLRTYYDPKEITPLINKYNGLTERYAVLNGEISVQEKTWLDECKKKYNIKYKNNLYYIILLLYVYQVSSGKIQHQLYIRNNPNTKLLIGVKLPETVKTALTDTYNKKYVNDEYAESVRSDAVSVIITVYNIYTAKISIDSSILTILFMLRFIFIIKYPSLL